MLVVIVLGAGFLVYSAAGKHSAKMDRQNKTDAALAIARDALLGRALSDSNRPGSLPCPDVNDDGQLTLGVDFGAGGACMQTIGRLPWRTLELPELRDGDGEHLWYAISPAFSDTTTNPINTDSIGSITVYSGSTTSVVSSRAVGVVFAPGAPLGNQARSPTQTALCPTTGTTIAQSLCANNYLDLDTASGINNANATGPYITVATSGTFNDRMLVVSDSVDLMTPIEARAASAILTALQAYKAGSGTWWGCNCYPWADIGDGFANDALEHGRVPLKGADTGHSNDWADVGVTIPQWLIDNQWWLVFLYTVAPNRTYDHNFGSLTVNGVAGTADIVLISAGAAISARATFPTDYIEDAENNDFGVVFITPTDTASKNRDRLYTLP
ncbi:MAG TPA: hypothetical protein VN496_02080 [Burkholderiales bacterium]|nr:hypothetical protein [Burkholderiales bacterium]